MLHDLFSDKEPLLPLRKAVEHFLLSRLDRKVRLSQGDFPFLGVTILGNQITSVAIESPFSYLTDGI